MSRKKQIKKAKINLIKVKHPVKAVKVTKTAKIAKMTKVAKLTATDQLEKQLQVLLAKLPQQCRKDLSVAKQQAAKWAVSLKKAKAQKKSAAIAKLTTQLEQAKKHVLLLSQKRAVFSDISKTIAMLLKQAASKPAMPVAKVKSKKPKKAKTVSKVKGAATTTRYEAPKAVNSPATEMTSEFEFENA